MLFSEGPTGSNDRELAGRVNMLSPTSPDDRSAILKSIPEQRFVVYGLKRDEDLAPAIDGPGPAGGP